MTSTEKKRSLGILKLSEGEKNFQLTRYEPSEPLRPFVKHYWVVSWNLEGQAPYLQNVVPNPCANMVMENHQSGIYGPASRMYTKKIEGRGQVFGIKFHPGGFYPFIQTPLSKLTDHALSLEDVFGKDGILYEQQLKAQTDTASKIALTESLLLKHLPHHDESVARINLMIAHILADSELTSVEQLCRIGQINKRKLQRLFNQYVGISPKWVIRLYRLQNAAEAMDNGRHQDLLKLSAELGYYDQSHFIKDFKSIIGKTPEAYTQVIPYR
jgi:AraC-like DNA-binding protein